MIPVKKTASSPGCLRPSGGKLETKIKFSEKNSKFKRTFYVYGAYSNME
jgi:hypothetical protein